MAKKDWIDTAGLTLAEWLKLVYNPFLDDSLIRHSFPSGELLNEYIATVQSRSHEEVERLLLFLLIEATSYSHDENRFRALMNWRKANDKIFKDLMSHTSDVKVLFGNY